MLSDVFNFIQYYYQAFLHSHQVLWAVEQVHQLFTYLGIKEPHPDAAELTLTLAAPILTLLIYFICVGRRHKSQRQLLGEELMDAERKVAFLQEQLARAEQEEMEQNRADGREIRVFMEGAFDMMHYGHMNAFRQGRALGTYLVVGVNSDESITKCKGAPPVMSDDERIAAVKGCKFVDEVIERTPYVMTEAYLEWVIKTYKIDIVVHGDDPCIVDGRDVYGHVKEMGMYRSIPRTEGVSTTDIVGRMLLNTKEHHHRRPSSPPHGALASTELADSEQGGQGTGFTRPSHFLTTSRMIRLFSANHRDPPDGARVVYMDGAWDMFHAGHVNILRQARELGDYLIVGVHNDDTVNRERGSNRPIMNMQERMLSVLGCKFVDDVLIDAPWIITREMIASLGVSIVAHGSPKEHSESRVSTECYAVPRELGIYQEVSVGKVTINLSVGEVIRRIKKQEDRYIKKFAAKTAAEQEYYTQRYNLSSPTGGASPPLSPTGSSAAASPVARRTAGFPETKTADSPKAESSAKKSPPRGSRKDQ